MRIVLRTLLELEKLDGGGRGRAKEQAKMEQTSKRKQNRKKSLGKEKWMKKVNQM